MNSCSPCWLISGTRGSTSLQEFGSSTYKQTKTLTQRRTYTELNKKWWPKKVMSTWMWKQGVSGRRQQIWQDAALASRGRRWRGRAGRRRAETAGGRGLAAFWGPEKMVGLKTSGWSNSSIFLWLFWTLPDRAWQRSSQLDLPGQRGWQLPKKSVVRYRVS